MTDQEPSQNAVDRERKVLLGLECLCRPGRHMLSDFLDMFVGAGHLELRRLGFLSRYNRLPKVDSELLEAFLLCLRVDCEA